MKNYNEVAESVFRRSEEIIKQNAKRRRTLISIGSAAGCLLIAGSAGFGVWRNSVSGADMVLSDGQFANDGRDHSTESDTVDDKVQGGDFFGNYNIAGGTAPDYSSSDDDRIDSSGIFDSSSSSGVIGQGYATSTYEPAPSSSIIGSTPLDGVEYDFIVNEYPQISSGTYDVPANGTVYLSEPLKGAMKEKVSANENENYLFEVVVEFYKDGACVDVNSSEICDVEWNRLCGNGYRCGYERCAAAEDHLCMVLTGGQLENFVPAEGYGYAICLAGECNGSCVRSNCLQHQQNHNGHHNGQGNGYGQGQSVPQDNEQNQGYGQGQGYGSGNGQGYGTGNSQGNGQGYGPGNGHGNGHGHGHGAYC